MTRSGFCNPSLPRTSSYDPHQRCRMDVCDCSCHQQQEVPGLPANPTPVGQALHAPGMYDGVPEEDYHRDPGSLSQSGAKTLLKAPALYRHQQLNPVVKNVFDFGHAAHTKVLGVGDPVEVLDFDDRRTKAYKEAVADARARGAVPILKKEADVIDAMADKLSEHTLAMELLSEGRPEVSAYTEDPETGVILRGRVDWLGSHVITDYKSAASADPRWFARKAAEFGYHQQAPWYLDLLRANGHPAEAFAFIVQDKNAPYLVTVVELVDSAVERGRELNRRAIDLFASCAASGRWPGFVAEDRYTSVDVPQWAYVDAYQPDYDDTQEQA